MKQMRLLFLFVVATICGNLYTQELVVKNICELPRDLLARTNVFTDKNGKECAVVRINVPTIKNIEFENELVIHKEYLPGEYIIYLPEHTNRIKYTIDGNINGYISFNDFKISIQSKKVYRCILQKMEHNNERVGSLEIETEPVDAIILLDGIPIGETPLSSDDIPAGKHILSVANLNGMSIPDTAIYVEKNKRLTLSLQLREMAPREFDYDIAKSGGDTSGWKWTRYKKISKNGKVGLADLNNKIIVPCEYDNVYPDIQNGFFVVYKDKKSGLYEPGKGLILAPDKYNGIVTCNSDKHVWPYMIVSIGNFVNQRNGFINREGKEIVPCIYSEAEMYGESGIYRVVDSKDNYSFLKIENDTYRQIGSQVSWATTFNHGVALIETDKSARKYAIIDTLGKIVANVPSIYSFNDRPDGMGGLFKTKKNGKFGYIDGSGTEVIPCVFDDEIENFGNGSVCVNQDNRKIIVTKDGKMIGNKDDLEIDISNCGNSYCIVKKNGKEGVVNIKTAELIIPCMYDECTIIRDGWIGEYTDYIEARVDEKSYLCDYKGNILFACPNDLTILGYKDGFIMIKDRESNTYGYANLKGDIIADCIYTMSDDIEYMMNNSLVTISDGLAMLILGDRYGFINLNGEFIVPLNYTGALPFENGKALVRDEHGVWTEISK